MSGEGGESNPHARIAASRAAFASRRRKWRIRILAERNRDAPIMGKGLRSLLLYLLLSFLMILAVVFSAGTVSQLIALKTWTRVDGRFEPTTITDPDTGESRRVCIAFDHAGATHWLRSEPGQCFEVSEPVTVVLPPDDPSQARLATFYGIVSLHFVFTVTFVVFALITLAYAFGPLIFRALHPSLAGPR